MAEVILQYVVQLIIPVDIIPMNRSYKPGKPTEKNHPLGGWYIELPSGKLT